MPDEPDPLDAMRVLMGLLDELAADVGSASVFEKY